VYDGRALEMVDSSTGDSLRVQDMKHFGRILAVAVSNERRLAIVKWPGDNDKDVVSANLESQTHEYRVTLYPSAACEMQT